MEFLSSIEGIDTPLKLIALVAVLVVWYLKTKRDNKNHKESIAIQKANQEESIAKLNKITISTIDADILNEVKNKLVSLREETEIIKEKLNLLLKKSEHEDTINIFPHNVEIFMNKFIDDNKSVDNGLLYIFNNFADNIKLLYKNMTTIDASELNYNTFDSRLNIVKQKMHLLFHKYIADKNINIRNKKIIELMQNQEDILKSKIIRIFDTKTNGELLEKFGDSLFEFVNYVICLINENIK